MEGSIMTVANSVNSRTGPVVEGTVYDYLLGTIPVPLVLGAAVASVVGVPVAYGVGAGAVLSALLVGYALWGAVPTPAAESPAGSSNGDTSSGDATVASVADD